MNLHVVDEQNVPRYTLFLIQFVADRKAEMHPDRLAVLKSGLERFHEFAHTESLVAKCLLCRFCFFGFGLTAILSFLLGIVTIGDNLNLLLGIIGFFYRHSAELGVSYLEIRAFAGFLHYE